MPRMAALFKSHTWEDLKMLAKNNETMTDAISTIYDITQDTLLREQIRAREERLALDKRLQMEADAMRQKIDNLQAEKDAMSKRIAELEAQLRDSQSTDKSANNITRDALCSASLVFVIYNSKIFSYTL